MCCHFLKEPYASNEKEFSNRQNFRARFFVGLLSLRAEEATQSDVQVLIPWLLKEDSALKGIAFADVISATSGKNIFPFDPKDADGRRILAKISAVMEGVLKKMNAPDSEVKHTKRINEASSHFENAMQAALNVVPDFSCDFPRTTGGRVLRSGYPDLRLVDKATGRVVYLDPKLYAQGSKGSSFRTFYFEPKGDTNKVNDDAQHLIVGIEHGRDESGGWTFTHWELIDLSHFRVKLKAEFEGSNRDMYKPDAVVGAGPK